MRWSRIKKLTPFLMALWLLTACATNDTPFSLVGDSNEPAAAPLPEGSGNEPPPVEGCVVNFIGTIQLKVSADSGSAPIEVLDARPVNIDPVPFIVDGGTITLTGEGFPSIILDRLSDSADLRLTGVSGFSASGTYDSATGAVDIPGYKLNLEILDKSTGDPIINEKEIIEGLNFTTDSVTATGNLNSIEEQGSPLSPDDLSVTLVVGLTLPETFQKLSPLNGKINGGALTARFEGVFDQAPENCTEGGGGTPPPSGASGPKDLTITVDGKSATEVDFGTTLGLISSQGGKPVLNCEEADNRGAVRKTVTISNAGTGERKIKLIKAVDTDTDHSDPLCSGTGEFVRGTIRTEGAASCNTIQVGGKDFTVDECTLPEGGPENKIIFPLIYMPFNYLAPVTDVSSPGVAGTTDGAAEDDADAPPPAAGVMDTGSLVLEYDDQTFSLPLKGITEADTSNALSVSKVTGGVVSQKEVPSGGQLKIAVASAGAFTQDYVIKNSGSDSWENISFALQGNEDGGTSHFSVTPGSETALPAGTGSANPGLFDFSITFNSDGSSSTFDDRLTISMKKAGSTAQVDLIYVIKGTVGETPILGDYQLQIDFMTGLINSSLQDRPVESLDFRDFVEQAPKPQAITINPVNDQEFKPIDLLPNVFDLLSSTAQERSQALRILNAQGSGLNPGDDSTMCNDPNDINKPYPSKKDTGGGKQDCAYFYFDLKTKDGAQGLYDEETGDLTLPDIEVRVQNPYHDDVGGVWPPSAPPNGQILDTLLSLSLTTKTLDQATDEISGLPLISDNKIGRGDLNLERTIVKDALFGEDCIDPDPIKSLEHPHFKCYLTPDGKYLQGRPVSLRAGKSDIYDVVFVGVGKFNSNTLPNEEDIPVFLSNNNIYLVIQGRLCPEGVDCSF